MEQKYVDFAVQKTVELLGIDSPTGYTQEAADFVYSEFAKLGYDVKYTNKGGVIVDLGGSNT